MNNICKVLRRTNKCNFLKYTSAHYLYTDQVKIIPQPRTTLLQRLVNKIPKFNFDKSRLKVTGYFLYESVVDSIKYDEVFDKLDIQDSFYSWFVITELHLWMLMVRFAAEADNAECLNIGLIQGLWEDVDLRVKMLGEIPASIKNKGKQELSEQLNATIISYDEGLLTNDMVLAGALWRRLYQMEKINIEHLEMLVRYIRRQIKILDGIPYSQLSLEKSVKWEPVQMYSK